MTDDRIESPLNDCEPFFRYSRNLLGILDQDLKFKMANPAFSEMLGVGHPLLLGQSILEFLHPDDRVLKMEELRQLLSKNDGDRFSCECRIRSIEGKYVWLACQCWVTEHKNHIFFVGVDKHEEIRERVFLREIQRCAKVGGWEVDLVVNKIFWSDETHEIMGTNPQTYEPTFPSVYEHYVPEDREKVRELVEVGLKEARPWAVDAWIQRGAKRIPVRVISKVEFRDGKLTRLYGTFQDISEHKQYERELIEREARLNLVIEAGNVGFLSLDFATNMVTFSERLSRMLGIEYTGLQQPLKDWFARIHVDDLADYRKHLERIRHDGKVLFRKVYRVANSKGETLQILSHGKVVRHDDEGNAREFIAILTDVTAETENQLRVADQIQKSIVSQKLAALGEMAAGIAHEINNPLTVIAGRAATLVRRLSSNDYPIEDVTKNLKIIEETTFRIAKIINGLTHFAYESEQMPKTRESFRTILEDTLVFCAERFRNNGVTLTIDERVGETLLNCVPLQISQVVLNMLNNAYDAVQAKNEKWVKVEARAADGWLAVSVTDSGLEISPEIQSKMMNPFFSTKGVGKGTGLGLSVSKGIIEGHGGKFYYQSAHPNTTFIFELPTV